MCTKLFPHPSSSSVCVAASYQIAFRLSSFGASNAGSSIHKGLQVQRFFPKAEECSVRGGPASCGICWLKAERTEQKHSQPSKTPQLEQMLLVQTRFALHSRTSGTHRIEALMWVLFFTFHDLSPNAKDVKFFTC